MGSPGGGGPRNHRRRPRRTGVGRAALRAGRNVKIANSRGPESLASVVRNLGEGAAAATVAAAASCDIVALAVPWTAVPAAVAGFSWDRKVLIDATNALILPDLKPAPLDRRTSSEVVAELVGGAGLVKAGNTLGAEVLGEDPRYDVGRRVMFVSGDREAAKAAVTALFDAAGFFVIDLGGLIAGGQMQQFGGPLAGQDLIRTGA